MRFPLHRLKHPLDRVAIASMGLLGLVIAVLILLGDHASAQVREFSWQDRQIGAENAAFLMVFNRPMDQASVEANLRITPTLPGKVSWAGRRMAYTLGVPAPYGEHYEVTLDTARDRFAKDDSPKHFQAFRAQFQTRDLAFAYIGIEGDEKGRLVLINLTREDQIILTPPDLVVLDFKPYPLGDRLLFAATDQASYQRGELNQKLYTVTTGLNPRPPEDKAAPQQPFWRRWFNPEPRVSLAKEITPVLDSQDYQNLRFDLSPDGKTIVVQRVSRTDPSEFGPWVITESQPPTKLETPPGGDFLITPDSQSLIMLQGEGTAILPLFPDSKTQTAVKPLDFLPQYGRVFDFTSDGTAAAMVNYNQDDPQQRYVESLVLVTNQGTEKELLKATGTVMDAQFDPSNRILYCLVSELLPGETYAEQPYLTAINIKTGQVTDLLKLPSQPSIHLSVAPDGLALLLDDKVPADPTNSDLRGVDGSAIATSHLWLLPLFQSSEDRLDGDPAQLEPQQLPMLGLQPTWLP